MTDEVEVLHLDPIHLAAVQGRVNYQNVAKQISVMLVELWREIGANPIDHLGTNVVFYDEGKDGESFMDEDGVPAWTGVQLKAPLSEAESNLTPFSTPAGKVAHGTHIGLYSGLIHAHKSIRRWCVQNGYKLRGPNWESYGRWTENENELRTDVYYLLADDSGLNSHAS